MKSIGWMAGELTDGERGGERELAVVKKNREMPDRKHWRMDVEPSRKRQVPEIFQFGIV